MHPPGGEGAPNLLARISRAVAESGPDGDTLVAEITAATAEALGGGCSVHLFDEHGSVTPTAPEPELVAGVVADRRVHRSDATGRSVLAAPLVVRGELLGVLLAEREGPFGPDDPALLEEVAARVAQAVYTRRLFDALETERRQMRTLVDTLPSGFALVDADGRMLSDNHRREAILRTEPSPSTRLADWAGWVAFHPEGRRLAQHELPLARSLRNGEIVRGEEIRGLRADGSTVVVRVNASPVRTDDGRITGALVLYDDVTEQLRAQAALRDSSHQLRMIADALPALVSYVGRDYRYRFVNRAYGEWFGRPNDEIVGRPVREVLGEEAAARVLSHLDAAMAGRTLSFVTELSDGDGPSRHTATEYVPLREVDGEVQGVVVIVREVTESRRAEERAGFLADASRVLSSSLDVDTALRSLAEVAVPRIADLCVIQLVGPDGIRQPHTIHAEDPALARSVGMMMRRWPIDLGTGSLRVFRPPEPELLSIVTDGMLVAGADDDEHLAVLRSLGVNSALMVPIPTSLGTYATLSLSTTKSRRRFDRADLELAREIASRTGLAIDNARLLREAREADRAKDEFLAMLAHELRNPLATIMTGLELVVELGGLPSAVQRTFGSVERQTTKLARLVDDLLDVSRITRGKIELRPEGCLLHLLIGRAVDAVRPLIDSRRHTLAVDVPEGIALLADPVRMEQVFANLLNNAAKYTEPGGRLRIEARPEGETVAIVVSDDGIGIDADVLPHVFQPFRQGMVGLDRSYGGLGLGLTLVERLVSMHEGSVRATSDGPGRGSTFTVRLRVAESSVAPSPPVPRPTPVTRGRRVLIVDDNTDAATATAELLSVLGHQITVAHDGPMALRLAAQTEPEVILLDLGLPGMDGYEVASRLRADGNRSRIVALSGYGREQDRRDTASAGFDRHLVKPVTVHTLLGAITEG